MWTTNKEYQCNENNKQGKSDIEKLNYREQIRLDTWLVCGLEKSIKKNRIP